MKARGQYLIGIDFDQPEPRMLAVPMRGQVPLWQKAEIVSKEAFEDIMRACEERADKAKGKPGA